MFGILQIGERDLMCGNPYGAERSRPQLDDDPVSMLGAADLPIRCR